MKTSNEKLFDALLEEDSINKASPDISKIIEEKMEKGIAEIEKRMTETINNLNVSRETSIVENEETKEENEEE